MSNNSARRKVAGVLSYRALQDVAALQKEEGWTDDEKYQFSAREIMTFERDELSVINREGNVDKKCVPPIIPSVRMTSRHFFILFTSHLQDPGSTARTRLLECEILGQALWQYRHDVRGKCLLQFAWRLLCIWSTAFMSHTLIIVCGMLFTSGTTGS